MSLRWVHEGKVESGEFCNAQGQLWLCVVDFSCIKSITGIVQQLGETGVAMTTLVSAPTFMLDQFLKQVSHLIR